MDDKENSLHGKVDLENKINMSKDAVNQHDGEGSLAETVRKAVVLDYLSHADVQSGIEAQKKSMPEFVDHETMSDIYKII